MMTLAEVNARFAADIGAACRSESNGLIYKRYSISWSGWIGAQHSSSLVGQIKAWPCVGRTAEDGLPNRWFVGIVRGRSWGEYKPGDWWDVRPPEGQNPWTLESLNEPGGYEKALREIRSGISWVLTIVQNALGDIPNGPVPRAQTVVLVALDRSTGDIVERNVLWDCPWRSRYGW